MAINDDLKGRLGSVRETTGGITDAATGAAGNVISDISGVTG